jgi:hypothetical protein
MSLYRFAQYLKLPSDRRDHLPLGAWRSTRRI